MCADVSENMLETGRKLAKEERLEGSIEFKVADITGMACFGDGSFDSCKRIIAPMMLSFDFKGTPTIVLSVSISALGRLF